MSGESKPQAEGGTPGEQVLAPTILVEMDDLQDAAGNAVAVLVRRIPMWRIAQELRALPGAVPGAQAGVQTSAAGQVAVVAALDALAATEKLDLPARRLIALAAVRPPFVEAGEPPGGHVSAEWLTDVDRTRLLFAILDVSGWLAGPKAPGAGFRGRQPGTGDGRGAGRRGGSLRDHAVGPAAAGA